MPVREASLKRRFAVKLASNVASIPLFFAMEAILPRALGPAAYGNYNYINSFFQQITGFVDMGSSACFYNSLSRRQSEFGLVAFYARVMLVVLAVCMGAGVALGIPALGALLIPGVPWSMAVAAAFLGFLVWTARVVRSMDDALGVTASSELVRMAANLFAVAALVGLFCAGALDSGIVFLHQYALHIVMIAGFLWCLRGAWPGFSFRLRKERTQGYVAEFSGYSMPLFVQALASAIVLAGERWILQFFGGSVSQGYFSLSQKVGMACFLFVTAMTPLVMREFSLAHGRADRNYMAALINRYGPMLYAVAAFFSCFAAVEARWVVRILGGEAYAAAILPVQIMALYPLHQSYGQVIASFFLATGDTRALRNNTLASLAAGILAAWFLLAPGAYGGMSLGAAGLAVKMVAVQCVFVLLLLYKCSKSVPLDLRANLLHQLLCPLVFLGLAWLGGQAADLLRLSWFWRFTASGVLYTVVGMAVVCCVPWIAGFTRRDIIVLRDTVAGCCRRRG